MGRKVTDLTGQRFGKLIVVQKGTTHTTPSGQEKIRWLCLCLCGKQKEIKGENLKRGRSNTCGLCPKIKQPQKEPTAVFNRYKRSVQNQNIIFELSKEEFKSLTSLQNCFWCDREPNGARNKLIKLIPDLGYTIDNVFSVCQSCKYTDHKAYLDAIRVIQSYFVSRPENKKQFLNLLNKTINFQSK